MRCGVSPVLGLEKPLAALPQLQIHLVEPVGCPPADLATCDVIGPYGVGRYPGGPQGLQQSIPLSQEFLALTVRQDCLLGPPQLHAKAAMMASASIPTRVMEQLGSPQVTVVLPLPSSL